MLAALNICQPLLLERSLSFSEQPKSTSTDNIGYGLIGAYILVYVGLGVSKLGLFLLFFSLSHGVILGYYGPVSASNIPIHHNGQRRGGFYDLRKSVYLEY